MPRPIHGQTNMSQRPFRIHMLLAIAAALSLLLPWQVHLEALSSEIVRVYHPGWKLDQGKLLFSLVLTGLLISWLESSLGKRAASAHIVLFSVTVLFFAFKIGQTVPTTAPTWGAWIFVIAGGAFHAVSAMLSPRGE